MSLRKHNSKVKYGLMLFCLINSYVQAQGYLYATALGGGKYGYGTLVRYNLATNKDTVLINFDGYVLGAYPLSSVMQASNGLLYGTTYDGGKYGYGTIYSYNPATGKDSVWVNFDSVTNGCFPIANIMQAKSGLIYGTTVNGPHKFGSLFSLNIITGALKTEFAFDSVHGSYPWDAPCETSSGLLFGTTNSGGVYNDGVIFCYNPVTGKDSTYLNFNDSVNGQNPDCALCIASDSLLYGMTNSGGKLGYGVLFGFDSKSGTCKRVLNFNDTDGAYAYSNLVNGKDGLLYGMTEGGGIADAGIILSYKPGDTVDNVCNDLLSGTGANPFGGIIQAPNGLFYGATAYGGAADSGVIFSYNAVTKTYTKLMDYSNTNGTGYYPNASLFYLSDSATGISEPENEVNVKVFPNPGDGLFTFRFGDITEVSQGENIILEIYNGMGERVYKAYKTNASASFSVNMWQSPTGIYYYRVLGFKGRQFAGGKLIIEH